MVAHATTTLKTQISKETLKRIFTPSASEVPFVENYSRTPQYRACMLTLLKCAQRLGHFVRFANNLTTQSCNLSLYSLEQNFHYLAQERVHESCLDHRCVRRSSYCYRETHRQTPFFPLSQAGRIPAAVQLHRSRPSHTLVKRP